MIASPGWMPAPTTTWSSRSRSPSCAPACAPCCAATQPARRAGARLRLARCAVTLRNRVSVAAAAGVLVVVAAVSSVLYFSYAASLRSRVDATLVDAAQQASSIVLRLKQSVAVGKGTAPGFGKPVTVGSVQVQLFPGPVAAGRPTRFGPLDSRDVAVAEHAQPAYFASARHGGQRFRVYTAAMPNGPGSGGALVHTSRAAN